MARKGMTEDVFNMILGKQLPDGEKRDRADYLIETKDLEQTRSDVRNLIEKLTGNKSDA